MDTLRPAESPETRAAISVGDCEDRRADRQRHVAADAYRMIQSRATVAGHQDADRKVSVRPTQVA